MSEVVAMFALASVLAIYGSFKYFNSSHTEYNAFNIKAGFLEQSILELKGVDADYEQRFNILGNRIAEISLKATKLEGEMIEARGAIARKRQTIVVRNAIPVTIIDKSRDALPSIPKVPPTSKMFRKMK